ncbi:hypothetical protein BN1195_04454 [Chryseobacterium oranimense G311]|uniref:hypothetical protein n=1 Tax=Chryseobacterium oranimense TaxID=421058 RepID=UPI0005337789|nr:hypothetical protein [Chryseobacterium oranimense]CEJ72097.1 hypothetical protein BN1195_04454 [Chryseobacterium oranimense G311]
MSTIKSIEKSQTKFNKEILTISHQEYQSNSIFKDTSEIQIIAAFYLIFKMFRKIKVNFDINLKISGRKQKLK